MSELRLRLLQQKALTPEFPVVLRGDLQTQYQNVMDVLDLLGQLNITQVGLATKGVGEVMQLAQRIQIDAVGRASLQYRSRP